ncbi:WD40-repeat-containing domain protein [Thamnocephalis sphaerospora]|uniref:WD40-repeat-containing domain protein n=1 Tax=Thamnocephalis sphaerospora TaxID=78915 RepID=A0A4P9XJC7_9FUNG|nr:WD40-repeat-containing domain protein [Thamnocephalis sphaerospora]|eukprot:RKP05864.1 WD40-repeat-containing domain protein [Thamnocephalis sphaerospora]
MLTETVLTAGDGAMHLWDLRTGTALSGYKVAGPSCRAGCLALGRTTVRGGAARAGVMYAAQADKAMMHVYQFERDQPFIKFTLPEPCAALAVSHSGAYCAMGTERGRIYVWEVSSGALLRGFDAHFKAISALRFTLDDAALVTGSADATVKVWLMSGVVSLDQPDAPIPLHVWSDHSLPVTDVQCTASSFSGARVVTVSLDHTCKIWSLATGQQLLTLLFPVALSACRMHPNETTLFVGGRDGIVYQADLYRRRDAAGHLLETAGQASAAGSSAAVEGVALPGARTGQPGKLFRGHGGAITGLDVSMDGSLLVTASEDATAKVWDVASHQLLRTFTQHKGTSGDGRVDDASLYSADGDVGGT